MPWKQYIKNVCIQAHCRLSPTDLAWHVRWTFIMRLYMLSTYESSILVWPLLEFDCKNHLASQSSASSMWHTNCRSLLLSQDLHCFDQHSFLCNSMFNNGHFPILPSKMQLSTATKQGRAIAQKLYLNQVISVCCILLWRNLVCSNEALQLLFTNEEPFLINVYQINCIFLWYGKKVRDAFCLLWSAMVSQQWTQA